MNNQIREIFRRQMRPMKPIPTGEKPVLRILPGIRAVLFDIYGTLVISKSGDVGSSIHSEEYEAFVAALSALDFHEKCSGQQGVKCLWKTIQRHHRIAREQGITSPEVDILNVWRQTLTQLIEDGLDLPAVPSLDVAALATHYEARVNPAWPMPNALECLDVLRREGYTIGIISNGQFYTPELLPTLFGRSTQTLGFDEQLQYYSYRYGEAKPSERMYHMARRSLSERGIQANEVLYLGNDMLNDILPASQAGFHTALFAGDARSLRLRKNDPRTRKLLPDLVLTSLSDLKTCLTSS